MRSLPTRQIRITLNQCNWVDRVAKELGLTDSTNKVIERMLAEYIELADTPKGKRRVPRLITEMDVARGLTKRLPE